MKTEITKFTKTQYEIIAEIGGIFVKAGFGMEPQCTLNSWGDTLEDETVLDMLKGFGERMPAKTPSPDCMTWDCVGTEVRITGLGNRELVGQLQLILKPYLCRTGSPNG